MAHDSSASTFKFLVTTDNHLGFAERDARRGDDSFTTFEEVLRAARVEHDVDAMLLGGDLFHENKPSLGCLVRTCSLFRKYVLGSRAIALELLSDPAVNFPTHAVALANFHDPNLNVALPVFAIHGNHDDPVGGTSSLDLLATNGYINYFGHVSSLDDVVLHPVLLRKGNTYVALYGLGNVRDERLHRCFQLKKVRFARPPAQAGRRWFSILLLHQNRGVRNAASKAGVYESMLAGHGIDLVIWGNEHEQRMAPEPSPHGFDVVQPGSTILTSLSASDECNAKQYGVLEVRDTSYRVTPFTLRSVRPVVRRSVTLARDCPTARTSDAVEAFLHGVVAEMVHEAEAQVRRIPDDVLAFHSNLKYPLLRLVVDYRDAESTPFPQPNANRFGQAYVDVVANPSELLRPLRPRAPRVTGTRASSARGVAGWAGASAAGVDDDFVYPDAAVAALRARAPDDIRAKVADVFQHNARDACTLLSEPEVTTAVYAFAEKGERDAIDDRIAALLDLTQRRVWSALGGGRAAALLQPDAIRGEVERHKLEMNRRYARAQPVADDNDDNGDGGDTTRPKATTSDTRTTAASTNNDDNDDDDNSRHAAPTHDVSQLFDAVELIEPHVSAAAAAAGDEATTALSSLWQGGMQLLATSGAYGGGGNDDDDSAAMGESATQQRRATAPAATTTAAARKRARSPYRFGMTSDELDALEALPDDGLDRITLDALVARAATDSRGNDADSNNNNNSTAAVIADTDSTTPTTATRAGRGATRSRANAKPDGHGSSRRGRARTATTATTAGATSAPSQQPTLPLTAYAGRRTRSRNARGTTTTTATATSTADSPQHAQRHVHHHDVDTTP